VQHQQPVVVQQQLQHRTQPGPSLQPEGSEPTPSHSSVIQRTSSSAGGPAMVITNGRSTPSPSAQPAAGAAASKPAAAGPSDRVPCPSPPPVRVDTTRPFLCEWADCLRAFRTPKEVERHAIQEHCPAQEGGGGQSDIPCLWARCDGMKRKRFSLMTHLQDRHCHPQVRGRNAVRELNLYNFWCFACIGTGPVPTFSRLPKACGVWTTFKYRYWYRQLFLFYLLLAFFLLVNSGLGSTFWSGTEKNAT
jgi:hypothetical protein